ncbi:MAG: AAA family ATPase [Rhodothalassiaceae bacterium]
MYFSRLRLSGFKSFVDAAELPIEPGLTGIVGPNGCGKSNLLEALRWVMGETAPKSLRAGGMDEVIFSGTDKRASRNLADVTVRVEAAGPLPGMAVPADDALEVSRRIERGAGSAYRINGLDVRAQDVRLLFADAATGAHSPALVSQGRIGALVTAKPSERRAILEEAAGISGLYSRRADAQKKLRATEANLTRLQDVLAQLDGRLGQLKRQAKQAETYKRLSDQIRRAEAAGVYLRWRSAAEEAEAQERALAQANAAVGRLTGATDQARRAAEAAADTLAPLRQAQAEAAAARQRLRQECDRLAAEAKRRKEALAHAQTQLAQVAEDQASLAEQRQDADEALARLEREHAMLRTADDQGGAALAAAQGKLEQAVTAAGLAESAYDTANEAFMNARARRASLQGDLSALERRADRLARERADLTRRLDQLIAAAEPDAEQAQQALEQARAHAAAADQRCQAAAQALEEARDAEPPARQRLAEADQAMRTLASEMAALEKLLQRSEPSSDPPIIDRLGVPAGLEAALAAALGSALDAGEDPGAPAYWAGAAVQPADPPLPGGLVPLAASIKAPPVLARCLSQIGVAASPETAQTVAPHLHAGQAVVTADGQLWRWDGYRHSGRAVSAAAERLRQRNRLEQCREEKRTADTAVLEAQGALASVQHQIRLAQSEEQGARAVRRQADHAVTQAQARLTEAERQAAKLAAHRAALEAQAERLATDAEDCGERIASLRTKLAQMPDNAALEAEVAQHRQFVEAARGTLAEARARADQLARDGEMRRTRLAAIDQDRGQWQQRQARVQTHAEALAERAEAARTDIAAHQEAPARLEAQRHALADEVAQAGTALAAATDRLAQAETGNKAAQAALKQQEAALAQVREQRVRLEALAETARTARKDLARHCGERFACPPTALPDQEDFSADAAARLATQADALVRDRDRLGAVNLQAAEELAEVQAERAHLAEQRADLEQALARLRGAIGALNREGRERLLAAFEEVNGHFTELFTTLFGGGTAHLSLVDSDDPLEAGLEILASPPGKRLQSLSLLSGGEQALTALSLIFAVFLTNPAPICVLDEVDAPLDDANVERFCDLLDAMMARTQTRFLIVTHNAVTMARMHRLFGVTMAEKGVSTLVSVDLEAAEAMRAQA